MSAMDVKVVDASALAAIVFGEAEAAEVERRFGDARLTAPALLRFEMANTCLMKLRRYPDSRSDLLNAFARFGGLIVETPGVDYSDILLLAEQFRLTAYDASYLWLAQHLDAELVTLDRPLARAAEALRQT
jgi:predicted nucleic acid-binding protein